LTLRTFHNSGVAGGDITQGLPRVEELFEARTPKGQAFITEVAGLVDVWEDGKKYIVQITPESGKVERLPLEGRTVVVKAGSSVKAGDVLATGESDTRPLIAPFDGVIESAEDTLVIAAEAASPTRYEIPGNMQLVVKANDIVEAKFCESTLLRVRTWLTSTWRLLFAKCLVACKSKMLVIANS